MKLRALQLASIPLLLALALTACERSGSPPVQPPKTPEAKDPHAQTQAEMEKASMDFSNVVSVRLKSEGKRVEVVSVMPAVIAEARVFGRPAKTIFRVNNAGDALVLFSRDLPHAKSFRTEIKFADLESKKGFAFPVVQTDGSLREKKFEFEKIITLAR